MDVVVVVIVVVAAVTGVAVSVLVDTTVAFSGGMGVVVSSSATTISGSWKTGAVVAFGLNGGGLEAYIGGADGVAFSVVRFIIFVIL